MKKILGMIFLIGLIFALGCDLKKETVMVPSLGRVCFQVEPASADIYLDGKYMGRANEFMANKDCLQLATGRHSLRIENSGFEPYSEEIFVGQADQWVSVRLATEKQAGPSSSQGNKDPGKGNH